MEKIKYYLDQFRINNLKESEILSILNTATDLSSEEKNLIFLYLYPRPLLDKELLSRFQGVRVGDNKYGKLDTNLNEVALIIEAGKTAQYNRFIKHLLHSFSNIENIHSIEGSNICNCCLCGKEIYELILWKGFSKQYGPEEEKNKLFLAYGSLESDLPICMPCLLNIRKSFEIINELEPGFLNYKIKKEYKNPPKP